MDFKSLVSKISSMDDPIELPKAPELPKAVQLNEDAQLRVLAGTSSYITEAKKKAEEKKEEKVKEGQEDLKKVGDTAKTQHGTMTKTKTGLKHERSYGKEKDEDDEPKAKKAKKESIDPEAFKAKFTKMVEAKKAKKDYDGDGKVESGKDEYMGAKDKAIKKAIGKKVDEASKPDFLDLDKDGNKKEPMKSAAKSKDGDKKDSGKKGMSPAQEKYFGKKNESVKTSKKVVAESIETTLSFKDMVKLVQESGGQQQIDPIDKELFNWATRVAKNKLGEGMKADIYAGLIYERNGGVFEMYDVLAEDSKKKVNEGLGSMFQKAGSVLGLNDKKNPEELRKLYLQNVRKDKSERKGSIDNFVSGVREITYFNQENDMNPSDETLMKAWKEYVLDQGGVRAANKAKAPKARNDMTGAL